MSFLSALFGRRADAKAGKLAEPVEYKGFVIRAAPYKNNGHYQTAGTIEREIGGVRKEHRFIRADSYAVYDDAVTFTVNKARQIIDLQGDRIFDQTPASSPNR
ncbi:MAG TPA: HlyU family transcriptional regulator [Xanthobacteraceae bacterium]|nr:HlyU family transcriptional regulator [Xanthobacteraceae bacterium]